MDTPRFPALLSHMRDELVRTRETVLAGDFDHDTLSGAVTRIADLTGTLAELSGLLAARAETKLPGADPITARDLREIVADLRTMSNHLFTARLLIEPAVADLAEYGR